jgi:hypothetical protein
MATWFQILCSRPNRGGKRENLDLTFKLTATDANGAKSFSVANAKEAIEKYLVLQKSDFQKIIIKDDQNRTLKTDEIATLAMMMEPKD